MTRLIALLRVNSLRGRRVPGFLHNGSHLKYDQFELHIKPLLQKRSTNVNKECIVFDVSAALSAIT